MDDQGSDTGQWKILLDCREEGPRSVLLGQVLPT